ncbi:MAG: hypothetical protein IK123_06710, partial [Lachnospiraceae bacterium]|nr:hypothetical protein [Lachnospiraceae bacterium]
MRRRISVTMLIAVITGLSVVLLSSCSLFPKYELSAVYRLHDDESDTEAKLNEDTLVIGQKDSGRYLESFS